MPKSKVQKPKTKKTPVTNIVTHIRTHRRGWIVGVVVTVVLVILILPHLLIALVDSKPITVFEYYSALNRKYGRDMREQLITEQLVENEAQRRGVKVSDTEVQSKFKEVENQASGSAQFNQLLSQQGLNATEFKRQIKLQLLVQRMFDKEASVSPKEVDDYIAQNQSQLSEVTDSLKGKIVDQLKQQKIVQAFQSWLQQAQSSNRVKRL